MQRLRLSKNPILPCYCLAVWCASTPIFAAPRPNLLTKDVVLLMVLTYSTCLPNWEEDKERDPVLFAPTKTESPETQALAAQGDERRMDELLRQNRRFILGCASKTARRFITESDDEWSIALIAFHEAVQTFDESRGAFKPFAALVIRRRLMDYFDRESRKGRELGVDLSSGELADAESVSAVQLEAQRVIVERSTELASTKEALKDEIEAMQQILRGYGFSFYDLADCSPKAQKTKRGCLAVVRLLSGDETLMQRMRKSGSLPSKELCTRSGASPKLLEKHRRYIIAAAEILFGDYPHLGEYLRDAKGDKNA